MLFPSGGVLVQGRRVESVEFEVEGEGEEDWFCLIGRPIAANVVRGTLVWRLTDIRMISSTFHTA